MKVINIPIPEKVTANKIYSGMHWTKRAKLATLYHNYFLGEKPYKGEYPIKITYHFIFKSRALDTTNCFFMAKLLEDGLVQNKVIPDDHHWIVHKTIITSRKGDADSVEIIIEEEE